jgi:hypothetical protein
MTTVPVDDLWPLDDQVGALVDHVDAAAVQDLLDRHLGGQPENSLLHRRDVKNPVVLRRGQRNLKGAIE